jgi:MFS family permease
LTGYLNPVGVIFLSTRISANSEKRPKLFYGFVIVASIFVIMLLIILGGTAFGVFFKPVSETFNWSRAAMSGAFSLSSIVVGISAIILGGLNDKLGPRLILTVSGVFAGAGFLLMSRISSLWQLYVFYGLIIGFGQGGTYTPLVATLMRWFTKKRSLVTGIALVGLGIGSVLSAPVANTMIEHFDWQTSYLILGILTLVGIVIAAQFLKRDPSVMGLLPYGETDKPQEDHQNKVIAPKGLSIKESLRTRQFWTIALMECIFGWLCFTIMVHLVPHVTDLNIPGSTAALMLAVLGIFSVAGRLILGPVGDKIGNRKVYILGFLLFSIALFFLIFIKDVYLLYLFCIVFGFAYGGIQSSESPLVAWTFGTRSMGSVFGMMVFAFSIGSASGSLVTGYIYDTSGSYIPAFIILAVIGIIGMILTISLKPLQREQ